MSTQLAVTVKKRSWFIPWKLPLHGTISRRKKPLVENFPGV